MNSIERAPERVTNHRGIVRRLPLQLVCILIVSAGAQLALAVRFFGFMTGDDVEVLAEAFRVATGFRYRAWDIRNLFIPDFVVAPPIRVAVMLGVSSVRVLAVIATLPFIGAHAVSTILVQKLALRFTRDDGASIAAAALFALHWIPLGFGSTVYPRTLATTAVLAAVYLLLCRSSRAAGLVAGALAAVAFADRFSEVVFLLPLAIVARRRVVWLLAGFASVVFVTIGFYDAVTWGEWFGSLRKFAQLTFIESDFASRVKHQSSLWYLLTLPRWLSPFLIPLMWSGLRREVPGEGLRPSSEAVTIAMFVVVPLVAFSAVAHKELRYLHGVLPWVALLGAMGLARFGRIAGMSLVAGSIIWQLYGLNTFAKKSMPAVVAAGQLGKDASVDTVAMSQLWAYGDRLYFGDRMQVVDVGTPPVRLREGLHADAICLYERDVVPEIEVALGEAGFRKSVILRSGRARAVVVYRRRAASAAVSETSDRARR
ncbi:MAG: hypothetical protein JJE51_04450 [Thermoanaerobaculia bacterium]|nr:hypothetical protein [Thermoanaerobaculia bacterium]